MFESELPLRKKCVTASGPYKIKDGIAHRVYAGSRYCSGIYSYNIIIYISLIFFEKSLRPPVDCPGLGNP